VDFAFGHVRNIDAHALLRFSPGPLKNSTGIDARKNYILPDKNAINPGRQRRPFSFYLVKRMHKYGAGLSNSLLRDAAQSMEKFKI
jgi:hypothetical protein